MLVKIDFIAAEPDSVSAIPVIPAYIEVIFQAWLVQQFLRAHGSSELETALCLCVHPLPRGNLLERLPCRSKVPILWMKHLHQFLATTFFTLSLRRL